MELDPMTNPGLSARTDGDLLQIRSAGQALIVDLSRGLRALRWENLKTGTELPLAGPILEAWLDAAADRLWIPGWSHRASREPGLAAPDLDDRAWKKRETPANLGRWDLGDIGPTDPVWMRTRLFVPAAWRARRAWLVLGGYGLHDWRRIQVYVNGRPAGKRVIDKFWTGPVDIEVDRHLLRFDGMNVIALRLQGQVTRTPELDAVDQRGGRHFPGADVLGSPFEQCLCSGPSPLSAARWCVRSAQAKGRAVEVRMESADRRLAAVVRFEAAAPGGSIRQRVRLANTAEFPVTVMDVGLGRYRAGAEVTRGGQGVPVYVGEAGFVAVEHPAGWVAGEGREVQLTQHPGRRLQPGESFECMPVIFGAAGRGDGQRTPGAGAAASTGGPRAAFHRYVERRMRRRRRGHARPYAIFDNFGSWTLRDDVPDHTAKNSESDVMHSIARVQEGQRGTGLRFDLFSVDFWVDAAGDLYRADPSRFPRGFSRIRRALAAHGAAPGLWIDSSLATWSIGDNPATRTAQTHAPDYPPDAPFGPWLCRATEPLRTLYRASFARHIRDGVRLLKLDNLRSFCHNPAHGHLPGRYSTEPIHDAVISMLRGLDRAAPDAFIMLYWGYRSPWWLLYADTLFEPGLDMEASSPSATPSLYARDGVTLGLDQAQRWCRDVPALGKDSLGVWLSDWAWNSSIGRERWQEAFIMDLCRGSLLAQPWSDRDWLDAPGRQTMADLIGLLRGHPACFSRPRAILGDPWRGQPYGYCCTDGRRAFIALSNPAWDDALVTLCLDGRWGLGGRGAWDLYRWHPSPGRLVQRAGTGAVAARGDVPYALRPFEVVLLELVPAAGAPSLDRHFTDRPLPGSFARPSRAVPLSCRELSPGKAGTAEPTRRVRVAGRLPDDGGRGTLVLSLQVTDGDTLRQRWDPGSKFAAAVSVDGRVVRATPVLGPKGYAAAWQAWRIRLPGGDGGRFSAVLSAPAAPTSVLAAEAHWLPGP
jgi:hypothetical protein